MTHLTHAIRHAPAFHDLDPLGIVWHGHYPKFLELVRCALLQQYHYDYPEMKESGWAWPIVDMRLKYVRPLRYAQNLELRATIVEYEHRLKIDYVISDVDTGEVCTRAHTIQVAVDMATGAMSLSTPPVLAERLGFVGDPP
ncbi:MAG: acyl-CoA thioesterase [Myxococcales bacterium]|nr:acyl-CoA thioesterase [Myxococcales bacterium]